MAWRTCMEPGCPELTQATRCAHHATIERRTRQRLTDAQRPTARQRGYDGNHERRFRQPILRRDPICQACGTQPSIHADHWPLTRSQLIQQGLDPNDPAHGRGLCTSCHATHTARNDGGYGNPTNHGA